MTTAGSPAESGRLLGRAFAFCIWLGLVAGLVELAVLAVRKTQLPMLQLSADYWWTVPAAIIVVAMLVALPFLLMARWWRRPGVAAAVFVAAAVAALDLLMLVPRLAMPAAALLAAGIATQMARLFLGRPRGTSRVVRWGFVVAGVGLVAAAWFAHGTVASVRAVEATAQAAGPNVIVITLDTVRAASLSLYGYERATSPNLARHAARGVVFEHAFATAPWTLPSHGTLFSGRWPHELSADYQRALDSTHPMLAEAFGARGYATAGFVANLGYCGRDTGLARGFMHYEDYPRTLGQVAANSTLLRGIADNFTLRRFLQNDEHLNRVTAETLNRRFFTWLDGISNRPFFAFLNYFDGHEPYLPPPPFLASFGSGRSHGKHSPLHHAQWNPAAASKELGPDALREERDAYDEAIAYLDQKVGALLDELARRGVLDRTLVVITADHGEEFAEHRVLEHGYSMYRAGLQVPLMLILPGQVPAGRRIALPVSLRDVARTVLELTQPAAAPEFPGRSLAALWTGPESAAAISPILSELMRPPGGMPDWYPIAKGDMRAILFGGYRYILNGDGREELYDATSDPWEKHDLAALPAYQAALVAARDAVNAARGSAGR